MFWRRRRRRRNVVVSHAIEEYKRITALKKEFERVMDQISEFLMCHDIARAWNKKIQKRCEELAEGRIKIKELLSKYEEHYLKRAREDAIDVIIKYGCAEPDD